MYNATLFVIFLIVLGLAAVGIPVVNLILLRGLRRELAELRRQHEHSTTTTTASPSSDASRVQTPAPVAPQARAAVRVPSAPPAQAPLIPAASTLAAPAAPIASAIPTAPAATWTASAQAAQATPLTPTPPPAQAPLIPAASTLAAPTTSASSAPAPPTGAPVTLTPQAPITSPIPSERPVLSYLNRPISKPKFTKPHASYETLFGRNVIGIIASVLVFLGLVFLGFLVVPSLSDSWKIAAMFLLSALLTVGGLLLDRAFANPFTKALLGCGCGAFFISILLTNLWFKAIDDLVAMAALLAWIALGFVLVKRTQSLLLSIIMHAGMLISVCALYLKGLDESTLIIVLVYQLACATVILVGNILCYKRTYRFGLFASLGLAVFASVLVAPGVSWPTPGLGYLEPWGFATAFLLIQFVCSSALAWMLFVSCNRIKNTTPRLLLSIATTVLWLAAVHLDILLLVYWLLEPSSVGELLLARELTALVVFALVAAVMIGLTRLRNTLDYPRVVERALVGILAAYLALICLWQFLGEPSDSFLTMAQYVNDTRLLYLIVPAALLGVLGRIAKDDLYCYLALTGLGLDAIFMLVRGYGTLEKLSPLLFSISYLIVILALIVCVSVQLTAKIRQRFVPVIRFVVLVLAELSLIVIALQTLYAQGSGGGGLTAGTLLVWAFPNVPYGFTLAAALLVSVLCAGAFHFAKRDRPTLPYRINEYALMFLAFIELAIQREGTLALVMHVFLAAFCLALMIERIRQVAAASALARREDRPLPNSDSEAISALALFLVVLGLVYGLVGTQDLSYVSSLACMIAALLIVALGFWARARSLRLVGLIGLVICVLKLTILDIGEVNSVMRVASFIGGGLICFAISALYNFLVKHQKIDLKDKPSPAIAAAQSPNRMPANATGNERETGAAHSQPSADTDQIEQTPPGR